jgi:hypothetical protein
MGVFFIRSVSDTIIANFAILSLLKQPADRCRPQFEKHCLRYYICTMFLN